MDYILSLLSTVGPFFLLLGFLIFFHELGHFSVARYFGVRVEIFSIGFGRTLFKYKKGDTEYRISLFPLGGYVKMYGDTPNAEIPEDQKEFSFIHKPVWPRIAVVLAGPLANLILAIFIFFVIGLAGETQIKAQLGDIKKDTVAYTSGLRSGDVVTAVNDQKVKSYEHLEKLIAQHPNEEVNLKVLRGEESLEISVLTELKDNPNILSSQEKTAQIEGLTMISAASNIGFTKDSLWAQAGLQPLDRITRLNSQKVETFRGLETTVKNLKAESPVEVKVARSHPEKRKPEELSFKIASFDPEAASFEKTELYLGQIQSGSPAEKAGLKRGDKILAINDIEMNNWDQLLNFVKAYKAEDGPLKIDLVSNFEKKQISVTPQVQSIMNKKAQSVERPIIGIVPGMYVHIPEKVLVPAGGVGASLIYGFKQTYKWTIWTFNSIKKVIVREVSPKNLGGLFTIGQVASDSFKVGWTYFLQMMGIISINLFLLNLIPIPVLDGGHLLFFVIEAVRGRPVSPKKMEIAFLFGFVLLISLMGFTLFNDVQRIFLSGW